MGANTVTIYGSDRTKVVEIVGQRILSHELISIEVFEKQEKFWMSFNIAIVGATGAVGSLVRRIMQERSFPYASIRFIASRRSAGSTIEFDGSRTYGCRTLPGFI